jgi:hypothetical protein
MVIFQAPSEMSHSATVEQYHNANAITHPRGKWVGKVERGGHGPSCPSPNGTCFLTNTCISTNKTCSTTGIWKAPTIGVFPCFLLTLTHTKHENTSNMVCFHARHLSYTPTHAEHEETPSMVSVRARRHSYIQQHTLNTKRHLQWCLFVLSAFPSSTDARRTRRDTIEGVCSCPASFPHPPTQAEHEETPSMVSVRARRHSTPN